MYFRLLLWVIASFLCVACQHKTQEAPVNKQAEVKIDSTEIKKRLLAEDYLRKYCAFTDTVRDMPGPRLTIADIDIDQDSIKEKFVLVSSGEEWESYFLILKEERGQMKLWYKDTVSDRYGSATFHVISHIPFRFELFHEHGGGTGFHSNTHEVFHVQGNSVISVLSIEEAASTNITLQRGYECTISPGKKEDELQVKVKYHFYTNGRVYEEQGVSDSICWELANVYSQEENAEGEVTILNDSITAVYRFNPSLQKYEPTTYAARMKFFSSDDDGTLSSFVKEFRKDLEANVSKGSENSRYNVSWILKHGKNIHHL